MPLEAPGTVEKAIDILFHLHSEPAPCGVTQIGRALDLPKSTAHRLLASLARRGLVEGDERGRYRPGLGLVALGLGVLDRDPVVALARGPLEDLAERLGETVFLTAARRGRIAVLDKVEGRGFLRATPRVGEEVPIHSTAVGKLYLAHAPELVSLPSGTLRRFTPRTLTQRSQIERAVKEALSRGYAENREEWIPGLVVIAVPILRSRQMVGAIAVAGPSASLAKTDTPRSVAALVRAAARIAGQLAGKSQ